MQGSRDGSESYHKSGFDCAEMVLKAAANKET
jgi:hypothetical protein